MAAAYAALVSLMNDLDLIPNHPRHSFSFENKQIESLSQTVHFLIDFMESHQSHGCNREAADFLESRIASAALEAHDVVQSHVIEQIHAGSTLGRKQRSYILLDLQKTIDNMNYVKRKVIQFKAKSGMKAEQPTSYSPPTSSAAQSSKKNKMVGFDAVLARLLDMLTGEASNRLVIPIVGMGGMGKTTLAKNAYEHSLVKQHFDVCYWATISQEYSVESILTQLLFGKQNCSDHNVNLSGEELHKKLWGRRYLIILDDMWSVDAWDEIQMFLIDNGNGSRVIVTTRLSNLATNLSFSPFKMDFLDRDQSWKLFCETTFSEEECPVELEKIGRKIMERCQGLPLSIIVIGGHLRKSSRAVEYWEKVSSFVNPISSLEEGEKCMEIISLSYHHLPIFLKSCFLYMGKFKEDLHIDVADLLKFWVVEGLIKPKEGLSLEEVAEDCLNDLIDRNFVISRGIYLQNRKHAYCSIHDVLREFCLKVGKKERFSYLVNTKEGECGDQRIVIRDTKECEEGFQHIRENKGSWLLDTDFQQVNLRYLSYKAYNVNEKIYKLPSSISLLWNLQTLIFKMALKTSAPQEIWDMTQLRHLKFSQLYLPDPILECIGLRNLQTLETVGNLKLTEEVCERIPNIKELCLYYDSELCSDCYLQNLCLFNKLESVRLSGHALFTLPLPSSLVDLELRISGLHWEDLGTMIKCLPRLRSLNLSNVKGHEWSLVDEEFPCLKYLWISNCSDLINWNANSSHFSALQTLHFYGLSKLSEIPLDIGDIPSLASISLWDCSESAAVSAMRILVEQERVGNDELHLYVYFLKIEEADRFQRMLQEQDLQSKNFHLYHVEQINAFEQKIVEM